MISAIGDSSLKTKNLFVHNFYLSVYDGLGGTLLWESVIIVGYDILSLQVHSFKSVFLYWY